MYWFDTLIINILNTETSNIFVCIDVGSMLLITYKGLKTAHCTARHKDYVVVNHIYRIIVVTRLGIIVHARCGLIDEII